MLCKVRVSRDFRPNNAGREGTLAARALRRPQILPLPTEPKDNKVELFDLHNASAHMHADWHL